MGSPRWSQEHLDYLMAYYPNTTIARTCKDFSLSREESFVGIANLFFSIRTQQMRCGCNANMTAISRTNRMPHNLRLMRRRRDTGQMLTICSLETDRA